MVTFVNDKIEDRDVLLSENDRVKKKIDWIIEQIKINPTFGEPIAKRLIPKYYKVNGISNAFWVSMSGDQRLIYSLTPISKTEINATIIEWFTNHKSYDKRFGY